MVFFMGVYLFCVLKWSNYCSVFNLNLWILMLFIFWTKLLLLFPPGKRLIIDRFIFYALESILVCRVEGGHFGMQYFGKRLI